VKRILFISLAVALALSMGLIGCGGETQEPEAPESIKVGVARDLDGLLSVFECGYAGSVYRWFVDKVNDEGGVYLSDYDESVPIELVVRDFDLMTWDLADVTEALIVTDECDFIWGGPGTDCIFTQAPVCNAHSTIFIGFEGGSASMIWDHDVDNWPYVWPTLSFSTWYQMPVLRDILEAELGRAPIAYMTYIGGPGATHGIEYSNACKEAFGEENFIDGGFHDYDLFETGAAPAVVSAAQAALGDPANPNYDVCIFQSYPWNTAALTITLLGSDFNPPAIVMGPGGSQQSHAASFTAAGVEGMMSYTVAAYEQTPEIKQMYDELAGQVELDWADPSLPCDQGSYTSGLDMLDYWGHPCYVAGLQIWQEAVENAGNLDSTAVRNELAKFSETNPADTVLGDTWFTVFGNGLGGGLLAYECHPGEIGQWQGGVYETVGGNEPTAGFNYPLTDTWAWLG
jgi:hypothetical protein